MNGNNQRQQWFERYPELFSKELDILKSLGFTLDDVATKVEGRLVFTGFSKSESTRHLVVRFPDAFPSSAPKIFDTGPASLLTRHHRIDTRQLCLFGFNEGRWCAKLSVSDALVEAEDLISRYKERSAALDNEPPEPVTSTIPYSSASILIPYPISTFTEFDGLKFKSGKFRGKFVHQGNPKVETNGRGIILEATFGDKQRTCVRPFDEYFKNRGTEINGEWFYVEEPPTHETLQTALKQCFKETKSFKKSAEFWIALIFKEETGDAIKTRNTWLIARYNAQGQFNLVRTFPYIQHERYVRIPGLEKLETKRVLIVGCGSLGSKIAANLAASGVNRFRLVDYDYFEPNNSVRHELGVEYFGMPKETALLSRLCSLNPAVLENSKVFHFQVAGINPFADEQQFYGLIEDSDLIIDATGIHSVTHFLNSLSFELRVPMVTASVTNGSWGGEIVRIVPGKTPCYLCWLDQHYDNKPPAAPESIGEVFAPGCVHPTFTGTTYDLGIVAGLATSICVDTLLPHLQHVDLTKNYLRWTSKDSEGKPSFSVTQLSTAAQTDCWCQRVV